MAAGLLLGLTAHARATGLDLSCARSSRWTVRSTHGVAWLVDPCGRRFYSIGINGLDGGADGATPAANPDTYQWTARYPDLTAWARATRARALAWGFNTAGASSLPPDVLGLPGIPNLDLGRWARFHWMDPFDPAQAHIVGAWARRLVAPYRGSPYRIGYFSDNEVGWWNGALFMHHAKQPPTNHTKQRLVALLREHYGGDWERFTRDFLPPPGVRSFDALLASTAASPQLRPGGAGIRVVRRWTGLVARRYYRLVHHALRRADPDALVFADRLPIYYDPEAVRAMAPYVDAVATNYDVDSPDGWIARYYFDGLSILTGHKPILVTEWFFAARENRTGNRNDGFLMTVDTQAERARGATAAAARFARHPRIIGSHWFQYYDHSRGGRAIDGEDFNFGLVDVRDRPYELLVAALRRVNGRLVALHAAARPAAAPARWVIPEAQVDARDRSLGEWPKEAALVPELVSPAPEVVFGDLYVAWSARGLHLAMIAMDYYTPGLLAYGGDFPRDEAFRVDWGVDAGAGARRFAIRIIPPKTVAPNSAPAMRAELCRSDGASCRPVAGAAATYFGSDQPRITAEVSLPWSALGVSHRPRADLRMELAATAFHRSRWMSWSGLPPATGLADPRRWRAVGLASRTDRPAAPAWAARSVHPVPECRATCSGSRATADSSRASAMNRRARAASSRRDADATGSRGPKVSRAASAGARATRRSDSTNVISSTNAAAGFGAPSGSG